MATLVAMELVAMETVHEKIQMRFPMKLLSQF